MSAISEIKIDGFKAFPNDFTLELKGKNLLLYGENGSGKSSIYYALHTLLQSQCKNKNNIYFDIAHPESIINKHTKKTDAKVEIKFEGDNTIYRISQNGYEELPTQGISPLRDLNGKCVFINHKFLFNVFSFRNSQYIDLFPVFIKDILPFVLTEDKSEFISQIYDEVMQGIKRHGRSNKIEDSYQARIDKFNSETKKLIDLINSNAVETATKIFDEHFKNAGERKLKITLGYENNKDKVPQPNKSYWLRCGHRYQYIEKAGVREAKSVSRSMEILQPAITLKIEELEDDGISYRQIEKPQTYFNEAKLTAIALSIRFSILDTISNANGRFMALDDLLISLDMSNRAKVIKYLLNISDKYKLYIFTHDLSLYRYIAHKIQQEDKTKEWKYKKLYYDNDQHSPVEIDEDWDYISKAKRYFQLCDYETSAVYLRKVLEQRVSDLLPYELKTNAEGKFLSLETLWDKLKNFYAKRGKTISNDIQQCFADSKLLILNPSAHYSRLSTPIYKYEMEQAFKLYENIAALEKLNFRLVLPKNSVLKFQHPKNSYKFQVEIDSDLVITAKEHIVAKIPKCKNIKWEYNGVEYWNFETNAQDLTNKLIKSTPPITNFFKGCIALPLEITHDMLMKHCLIDNIPLIEHFGDIDLLKISVKI